MTDSIDDERHQLLVAHAAAELARSDVVADYRAAPSDELEMAHVLLQSHIDDLVDEYLDLIPYVGISRCPHTGLVALYPIDTAGLDGLFWSFDAPTRPIADLPPTLFALTGAVDVDEPNVTAPFLVKPGPGAPYVLPRLLADERATAVVSSLQIGRHQAYCIAYYASGPLDVLSVAAEWGTDRWALRYPQRESGVVEMVEFDTERDFDLGPWIEAGRLRWIADDDQLVVRSGLDGCPYLGLTGRRTEVLIEDGAVR